MHHISNTRKWWAMKKIRSVYFNRQDLEEIEAIAASRRTTVSAVIRELVANYVKEWRVVNGAAQKSGC